MEAVEWHKGRVYQYIRPRWDALEAMVGVGTAPDYMWMHEIELSDGRLIQAYKHISTRGYLHLDDQGGRWLYRNDQYKMVSLGGGARTIDREAAYEEAHDAADAEEMWEADAWRVAEAAAAAAEEQHAAERAA